MDKVETLELFRLEDLVVPVEEKIAVALDRIVSVFKADHPVVVAYSGGKDSSVVSALVLHGAVLAKAMGCTPLVVISTGDTMVENAEVAMHYRQEMARMRDFAKTHRIRLTTKVVRPNMLSTWQLKVLTGRGLPSFAGSNADCSMDLKVMPQKGIRYDIPDVPEVKPTPMPDARFLFVGDEWDSTSSNTTWTGLRDALTEALTDGSPCARDLVELKSGRLVWNVDTDRTFSVDPESAALIEEFELQRLLGMHSQGFLAGGITAAYKWYLQYGCLSLSHSQQTEHDEVCRRTAYKDRLGLTLDYDIDHLISLSVGFAELPPAARKAWGGKATTQSAQTELSLV